MKVLKVLKNDSKQTFGETLDVAALSTSPGVPAEECTVYLEPYNEEKDHPWKLLGGGADQGVSHVAFAGFPVLPPIPNADPSVRRKKLFRLPTRFRSTCGNCWPKQRRQTASPSTMAEPT